MFTLEVVAGSVNKSVPLYVMGDTGGLPATSVAFDTAGVDLWYRREGGARVAITEVELTTVDEAHTDGGFIHVSDGRCRLDLPDAAFVREPDVGYVEYGGTFDSMIVVGGIVNFSLANAAAESALLSSGLILATGTIGDTGNSATALHLVDQPYADDILNDYIIVVTDVSAGDIYTSYISNWVKGTTDLATLGNALGFTPENEVDTYIVLTAKNVTAVGGGDATEAKQDQILSGLSVIDNNLDSVISTMVAGILAEPNNRTFIEQIKNVIAVMESQRSSHTHQVIGNVYYVDPVNGDTHASGNRGGISDPYDSVQDCHDNAVISNNHDLIILIAGNTAGVTVLTEDVTLSKNYLFIRGPGRDFDWIRSGSGNTISVTGDGIELAGFQVNTDTVGNGAGILATGAEFLRVDGVWVNDTRGDGIDLINCNDPIVVNTRFKDTGTSGAGHGLSISATTGNSSNNALIDNNDFVDVQGDSIRLDAAGTGVVNDANIKESHIVGSAGYGVNIVSANCQNTVLDSQTWSGNSSGNYNDSGTDTHVIDIEELGNTLRRLIAHPANTPRAGIPIKLYNSSGVPTPGYSPTFEKRVNSGAWEATTGSMNDVANGRYTIDASAADCAGSLGDIIDFKVESAGVTNFVSIQLS